MKEPIHTNDIYVGVAWFCNRPFFFYPSLPPHLPLCLLLFLSTQLQGYSTEESQLLLEPRPRVEVRAQAMSWPSQTQTRSHLSHPALGFMLPTQGRALSHVHKWNFLRFIYEKINLWGRGHLLALCPQWQCYRGSRKRHEAPHPRSILTNQCRLWEGMGDTTAFPGAWPMISFLFNPNSLPRSLGMGGAC